MKVLKEPEQSENHVFKLLTGVTCEVTFLTGMEYELLSNTKKDTNGRPRFDLMLCNVIVRVGSVRFADITPDERLQTVRALLAKDRRLILAEVRQYTFDFAKEFIFNWEGSMADGTPVTLTKSVPLTAGIFPRTPAKQQVTEYVQVTKHIDVTLPKSGAMVRLELLDGENEERNAARLKTETEVSALTAVMMRNPCKRDPDTGDWAAMVKVDLQRLHGADFNALFNAAADYEGNVDTEIRFDHPDSANPKQEQKKVVIDLTGEMAFFFPSATV